jgi:asparagine synthase (glutamine-hydrolysing)
VFRYLTLAFSEENPLARETARRLIARHTAHHVGWSEVLMGQGLYVACGGMRVGSSEPYLLDEGRGVVLGKLFEREEPVPGAGCSRAAPVLLDEAPSRAILASDGRHLIEHYWGRYVAFLLEPATSTLRVLRDPSAGLPCLMLTFGGVTLFFSSMEEVRHLGLPAFEVSWEFLTASVCLKRQHTHGTALRGVLQVLGGECVAVRGDRVSRSLYWDPVEIARSAPIEDPAEATRVLRACVRNVVHAWATSYEGILLSLSGGLDSSILFACLKDAPLKGALTSVHHYPLGPDTDERDFARRVVKSSAFPLIERARDSQVSLEPLRQLPRSHQPGYYLYALEHSRLDVQLAALRNAAAVFTGWGGDQLFFQDHAIWAAVDHVRRCGLGPRLWQIVLDCARMDRISVWEVLREAFLQYEPGRSRRIWNELHAHRALIRPEVLAQARDSTAYLHPLLRNPHGIPPGKLWHIQQLLSGPFEHGDPLSSEEDPDFLAPLYSQPVLEVCLAIPTDVLTLGGWPRAIARHAFKGDLPPEIINRWYKGGVEDHVYRILRHNITFVRELLLDGALVREGIVDRERLERALCGGANRLQTGRVELFEYLGIEAWLRAWLESPSQPTSDRGAP